MIKKQVVWMLVVILVGAAFMRIWALGLGDPMGDEAFRIYTFDV